MSSYQPLTLGWLLKQLLYHGQAFPVYPAAFIPQLQSFTTPSDYDLPHNDVKIQTSDKVTLSCYLMECQEPRATILMFHGNAMDHGSLLYQAIRFYDLNCNVLTVSYRGFPGSGGVPSERGLQKDAQAALDYILNHDRVSRLPIIVYGLSLGGAVAIDVVSKNADKITALIIENTFTSIPDVVRHWHTLISPFSFLCTQRWNSASKISRIPPTLPIFFCSGRCDEVVPPVLMDNLWEIAQKRGKQLGKSTRGWFSQPGSMFNRSKGNGEVKEPEECIVKNGDRFIEFLAGEHSDTHRRPVYWSYIKEFLNQCLPT